MAALDTTGKLYSALLSIEGSTFAQQVLGYMRRSTLLAKEATDFENSSWTYNFQIQAYFGACDFQRTQIRFGLPVYSTTTSTSTIDLFAQAIGQQAVATLYDAGSFVESLAHELGHFEDQSYPAWPELTEVPPGTHKQTKQEQAASRKTLQLRFPLVSHSDRVCRIENRLDLVALAQPEAGIGNHLVYVIPLICQQNFLMRTRRHFR